MTGASQTGARLSGAWQWFGRVAPLVLVAWVLIAFLYTPVLTVLIAVFFPDGSFSLAAIERLAGSQRVIRSLTNTGAIAALTLVTVNIVGLFQVAVLDFFVIRGSRLLAVAYATPLVFSSVAAVTGYKFVYSSHGFVTKALVGVFPAIDPDWFQGAAAVLFVHTFCMTGYHMLFVRAAIRRIDFSIVEAAQSLGVSPARAFRSVVLPLLRPTLMAVSLMVLLSAIGSFAAPSMLGGRDFYMISSMIQALAALGRVDLAALLSLVLASVSLVIFVVMKRVERKGGTISTAKTLTPLKKTRIRNPALNIAVHGLAYLLFVVYAAPILITIAFSFAPSASILTETLPTRFTLANYQTVLANGAAFTPLGNSLALATLAVGAALGLSLFSALYIRRNKGIIADGLEFSLFIPWVLPGLIFAIGLITAYGRPSFLTFGQPLVGTYWLLPIGYAIIVTPLMVRMLGAALANLDPNLDDAARSLGCSAWVRVRRVTLPLLAPVVILVAAMAFNELIAEYTLSVFLYNINNQPLGVALRNAAAADSPEQIAISLVYVVLLLGLSFAILMIASRLCLGRNTPASAGP